MIRELLSKKNYSKLKLLSYFTEAPNKKNEISLLVHFIESSTNKTSRYLKELQMDIENAGNTNNVLKQSRTSYVFIYDKPEDVQVLVETIRNNYLNESSLYLLCLCLCTHSKVSFHSLETTLLIGRTSIYKLLLESNVFLHKYGLEIIKTEYNYYQLIGNEINIRLFQCLFFMKIFSLGEEEFDKSNRYILSGISSNIDYEKFSSEYQKKLVIFHTIIFDRIHSGNYVTFNEKKFDEEIKNSYLYNNTIVDFAYIHAYTQDENRMKAECFLYQLMLFTLFPSILPLDEMAMIGEKISKDRDAISIFFTELIRQLDSVFNTAHHKNVSYTNFSIFHMLTGVTYSKLLSQFPFHELDNIASDLLSEKTFLSDSRSQALDKHRLNQIEYIFQKTKELTFYNNVHLEEHCKHELYTISLFFSLYNKKPVNIFIDFNRNRLEGEIIKNKIETYYNESIINFVKDNSNSDIQIVNSITTIDGKDNYFVISDIDNYKKFNELLNFIAHVYEKNETLIADKDYI